MGNYDTQLQFWNGSIIGPQGTPLGERIYTINIQCDQNYPDSPPRVKFNQKIIFASGTAVDGNGFVTKVANFTW